MDDINTLGFKKIYQLPTLEYIALIRHGIPASFVVKLAGLLNLEPKRLSSILRFPFRLVERKVESDALLSASHSEIVLGIVRMIGNIQSKADDAEMTDFNAAEYFSKWMCTENHDFSEKYPY